MLATAPSPNVNNRSNNSSTTTSSSTTTLLTKNNLLAFHHLQQQLDAASTNSVGILYIHLYRNITSGHMSAH